MMHGTTNIKLKNEGPHPVT